MPEVGFQNESPRAHRLRRWLGGLLGAVAILALAGGAIEYYYRTRELLPLPDITLLEEDDEPDAPAIPRNPGYLGPQACAPCHARRVAEFLSTPHARACRRPQDHPMPEGFAPGKGRFTSSDRALRFEMTRSGNEFFQSVERAIPNGEPAAKTRIDLAYGANKADEVFFTWKDDHIFELISVWLHPLQRWAHTSYDHHGSGSFARETTPRCLECHNTWIAHVPGTTNEYQPDAAVLGVSCERCHGPGREHVAFHQEHPGEKLGRAVIQPAQLSRDRRIEVCTQCHSNAVKPRGPGFSNPVGSPPGGRPNGNSVKPRGPAFSYRPGEPLDDTYRTAVDERATIQSDGKIVVVTRHPEDDHVANQIKYLQESKCFQKSELTCVTCHDPHRPHDKTDPATDRKACLQCHRPEACTDRPKLPAAVRDDCIGCHMPQRVWMNVHFHTEDDRFVPPIRRFQHRIAVDRIARSEVLLGEMRSTPAGAKTEAAGRLTAELVEHWLGESEKRQRDYRFLAAIGAAREALRLDPPPELRAKATAALRTAIDRRPRHVAQLRMAFEQFVRALGVRLAADPAAACH